MHLLVTEIHGIEIALLTRGATGDGDGMITRRCESPRLEEMSKEPIIRPRERVNKEAITGNTGRGLSSADVVAGRNGLCSSHDGG